METKTKRNLIIWAIGLLIILNLSSLATIWYHRYQFRKMRKTEQVDRRFEGRRNAENRRFRQIPPFMLKGLELTPAQKTNVDSLWLFYNQERRTLEDSLESNRRQLFDIILEESLDSTKYDELITVQGLIMRDLNNTMLDMNRAIRRALTPEQQKSLNENMRNLRNRMPRERRHRQRN